MQVDHQLEVTGVSLMNIIKGCGIFQSRITKMMNEKGIRFSESKIEDWYPLAPLMEIFDELIEMVGPDILFEVGKNVPIHSIIPEEISTFEEMLQVMDDISQRNHRNGSAGCYYTEKIGERKYLVRCDTVYPAAMNLGMLRGFSQKYRTLVRIEQLETDLHGGEFIVQW